MASMPQHLQPERRAVNVEFQIRIQRYKDTFLWRYEMQLKVVTTNWSGLLAEVPLYFDSNWDSGVLFPYTDLIKRYKS